jgi:hypothetical protein
MKTATLVLACLSIAYGEDMGVLRKLSENKFTPTPGLPSCIPGAVQNGTLPKGRQ